MGARSCLYGIYYSFSFVFFLILTVFQWTVVLPNLPLCANTCGVSVLQPLLLVGTTGGNCAPGLTEQQYYQNNCFYCGSGSDGVTWPCPATSGVPGCGEGSVRLAETCIGQNNATSASGQPVTSDFVGGGSFIDGLGNRQLCFTTPINISLRAAEVPIVYIFLSCYFILAFFALLQVVLHCGCFKSIRGREWAQLNRFQRCAGGTIRTVPLILFTFNVLLMCLLITASVLFWGIGVCVSCTTGCDRLRRANDCPCSSVSSLLLPSLFVSCVACRPMLSTPWAFPCSRTLCLPV